MVNKFDYIIDIVRIIGGEILDFIKNFKKINPNQKKLFLLDNNKTTKTLLIFSVTSNNYLINIESLFAKYFNQLGYKVIFLTNFRHRSAVKMFKDIGGKVIFHHLIYLKAFLKFLFKKLPVVNNEYEFKLFSYNGINIGMGAYSSVCRKYKLGQVDFTDQKLKKESNKFLHRSILYLKTARIIFKKYSPDLILSNEKGYVSQNSLFNLAVEQGIDFIQWVGCPEPNALVFKRYNSRNTKDHPHAISSKTWSNFKSEVNNGKYTREMDEMFKQGYLEQRWFKYNSLRADTSLITREEFVARYKLDSNKKIAILFAHVMWDGNLFYGEDLFEQGFEQWYIESIKAMRENTKVNWLIKIHPANRFKHEFEDISCDYREILAVKEVFGLLPDNIKFIYPEDEINPYALFQFIDYGITVRGTVGMELSCFGIPVLTAGTGRYSGMGFTNDSNTKEEYLEKLKNIQYIPKVTKQQIQLANLHAYLFFKARPLPFTSFTEKWSGEEQNVDIKISRPEEGDDLVKFTDWAANSYDEDFLNNK